MTVLAGIRSLKGSIGDLKSEVCLRWVSQKAHGLLKPEQQNKDTNERVKGEPQM